MKVQVAYAPPVSQESDGSECKKVSEKTCTIATCVPSIDWPEKIPITRIVNDNPSTQGPLRCDLAFVHMGRHGLLKDHGNVLVRAGTREVGLHGAQPSCSCKCECKSFVYLYIIM